MKKVLLTIVFGAMVYLSIGQQQGQYSQYMMNYFLINPGVAGTEDFVDVRLGYRRQWVGLAGAPRNYYASFHLPINKVHSKMGGKRKLEDPYHVLGGIFSGQKLGAFTHNTGYATYAFHLPLTTNWVMSSGAVLGFNQFVVDPNALNWGDNVSDPSVSGVNNTKFDLGLGIWMYSPKIFIGISSMQMLQNNINFSENFEGSGMLNRHFYLTGGYKFEVNQDFKVIPSLLFRQTATAIQMDINTKVRYREFLWGGISYRRTDALVLLAGVGIPLSSTGKGSGPNGNGHGNSSRIEIGYSYDLTTSRLRNYSGGSHEIMVGVVFPVGGRLICPSDYW